MTEIILRTTTELKLKLLIKHEIIIEIIEKPERKRKLCRRHVPIPSELIDNYADSDAV